MLAGCHPAPHWYGQDITGLMPNLQFQLRGVDGQPVTAANVDGKAVMLFFGYTSCPDVCPATLSRLAQAKAALPAELQQQLMILFVSVDPGRDTPAKLKQYTDFFGDGIRGLTGSKQELDEITIRYRTSYSYGPVDAKGNYVVSHGSGIYGFDRHGKIHLLVMGDDLPLSQLTADMKQLVEL